MIAKEMQLLQKLPIPFTALREWIEEPPHAIYRTQSRMMDDKMTYEMITSVTLKYLQTGMVKPGDLIPASQKAYSLLGTMLLTRQDPEHDEEVRVIAAITWQLVNNVLDLMDNMIFAKHDMPLAGEIAVVLKTYPDPTTTSTSTGSAS